LYEQFRQLIHEGAKFLIVGGIGLVITNIVYGLLRSGGVGPITATTVATIVATVVTYVGNRYWSFRHRERAGVAREGVVFLVLNGVGLLIQDAVVGFNAYVLGYQHGHKLEQLAALNVGIGIATLFRFWSYRKWVWAAPAEDAPATGAAVLPVPAGPAGPGSPPANGSAAALPDSPLLHANGHPVNGDSPTVNGDLPAANGHDPQAARRR
jgi:putative flippase GtrA